MKTSKEINLGDDQYFEYIHTKTGWTKSDYREFDSKDSSDYPLYTATLCPVAFVAKKTDYLISASPLNTLFSFASNGDGSAGKNFIIHKKPFYISNDRTVVKILDPKILSEYLVYKLRFMKQEYGFDFSYKATPNNLMNVSIEIPTKENGEFDLEKQQLIVAQNAKLENLKNKLISEQKFLKSSALLFSELLDGVNKVPVSTSSSQFSLEIGKRVLLKDLQISGVKLFSANVLRPFGYVSASNLSDLDKPSIVWGIDGNFDWNYVEENQEFDITDHCGRMQVKEPNIHPKYVYYALKSTKNQYGFDRTYRASLKNLKQTVEIDVPVKNDGNYDLDAQIMIAKRYEEFESVRTRVLEQLEILSSFNISLD